MAVNIKVWLVTLVVMLVCSLFVDEKKIINKDNEIAAERTVNKKTKEIDEDNLIVVSSNVM